MTRQEKLIVGVLAGIVLIIFAALGGAVLFWLAAPAARPVAALPAPVPSPPPEPTATGTPFSSTATPSPTPLPSPTSTWVVAQTTTPTPVPTLVSCLNNISDFEASGLITNEEVGAYLRASLPLAHFDNCRLIRYIPKLVTVHDIPASGRFIPIFRQISVYAGPPDMQSQDQILDTLIHEIGHNTHFNLRLENGEPARRWTALHKESLGLFSRTGLGFVSDYARSNEFEDFAESYLTYVRYPDVLRQVSPEKYEFMRLEVFGEKEYTP